MEPMGPFGESDWYDQSRERLYELAMRVFGFPMEREHERHYLIAILRRTLSLELAFRQAVESRNGQMAMTLIRLNLDTLARLYALYWAEKTDGMSAETFSRAVAGGKSIKDMKLRGSKEKATDKWLIAQIEPLADWIPRVYKATSGAIHFSDFHIKQSLQQLRPKIRTPDSIVAEIAFGPTDTSTDPNRFTEVRQAFLHITMMLAAAISHRCDLAMRKAP